MTYYGSSEGFMSRNYEADFVNRTVKFQPYKHKSKFILDLIGNVWTFAGFYVFFYAIVILLTEKISELPRAIIRNIGAGILIFLFIAGVIVTVAYFFYPKKDWLVKLNVLLEEPYSLLMFPIWRTQEFELKNRKVLKIKRGVIFKYRFLFFGETKNIKKVKFLYKPFKGTSIIVVFAQKVSGRVVFRFRGWSRVNP
jgi:hypothetical protein